MSTNAPPLAGFTVVPQANGMVAVGGALLKLNYKTGDVSCAQHQNDPWCQHINYLVSTQQDHMLIARPDVEWLGTIIKVPLVPTHGVWARVKLDYFHEATESYAMKLIVDDKTSHPIGFLQREEGRLAIRSILWAWFQGHVDTHTLKCTSSAHSFKQELAWSKNTGPAAPPQVIFAEYWTVWKDSMCLACYQGAQTPFDDLIPNASSGTNWP